VRSITSAFFISVDGVVGTPQNWHFPYLNSHMRAEVEQQQSEAGALLLGRRTYQEWAGHWPQQDPSAPLARRLNSARKLVASRTLTNVDWDNSTLLEGDAIDAVALLAAEGGLPIAVAGSPTLVRALLGAGVITELRLVVHPLVLGKGERLFSRGTVPLNFVLDGVHPHDNGVVVLIYRPIGS
jgi:dihydrofolate reductase